MIYKEFSKTLWLGPVFVFFFVQFFFMPHHNRKVLPKERWSKQRILRDIKPYTSQGSQLAVLVELVHRVSKLNLLSALAIDLVVAET